MIRTETRMQPAGGRIADLLDEAINDPRYQHLDAAIAYVTTSGVDVLRGGNPGALDHLERRWLTSFDWCRSDPVALRALNQGATSSVRIYDGASVVAKPGCHPRRPFHPKGYLFSGDGARLLISGSANLSRSGLTRGIEFNTVIGVTEPTADAHETAAWAALDNARAEFEALWGNASSYGALNDRYEAAFAETAENPARTDDDWYQLEVLPRGFSELDLVRIGRANTFWIEAGKLTPNLGAGNPGSQLMMKALTRVFFGFPAVDRPKQTLLGNLDIRYGGTMVAGLSIEYAHNGMDRLNLPRPSNPGPPTYDDQTLVFTKRAHQGRVIFDLHLATTAQKAQLRKQSKKVDSEFKMPGKSRRFGFCPT